MWLIYVTEIDGVFGDVWPGGLNTIIQYGRQTSPLTSSVQELRYFAVPEVSFVIEGKSVADIQS